LTILAACGGGSDRADGPTGDGPGAPGTADAVDKYAGSWVACFPDAGAGSTRELLVISKTGAATGSFSIAATHFPGAGCTGTSSGTDGEAGSLTIVGTKTVSGETVDKVNTLEGGVSGKTILAVLPDGTLHTGRDRNDPEFRADAEGFPESLNPIGYTRQ
jgi:hypothetical protein